MSGAIETIKETLSNASKKIGENVEKINNSIDYTVFGEKKKESVAVVQEVPERESMENVVKTIPVPVPEPLPVTEDKPIPERLTEPESFEPIKSLKETSTIQEEQPELSAYSLEKTTKKRKTVSKKNIKTTKKRRKCKKGTQRNRKTHRCNKKCPPGTKPKYTRTSKKRKCVKKI
jgi:hypothetical protein